MTYKTVKIEADASGFGGPLYVTPTDEKPYIASVTGGGIHEFAARVADLSGGKAVDAFKNPVKNENIALVVADCGGSARCGVYPSLGIKMINTIPFKPRGFLMKFMKPEIYLASSTIKVTVVDEGK